MSGFTAWERYAGEDSAVLVEEAETVAEAAEGFLEGLEVFVRDPGGGVHRCFLRRTQDVDIIKVMPQNDATPAEAGEDGAGCAHGNTERGRDIGLVYGTARSEICKDCGRWRTRDHYDKVLSKWFEATEYDAAPQSDHDYML